MTVVQVALLCMLAGQERVTGFHKDRAECETVRAALARAQKPPQACRCGTVRVAYPEKAR